MNCNCNCEVQVDFPYENNEINLEYCGVSVSSEKVFFVKVLPEIGTKNCLYVVDTKIYRWNEELQIYELMTGETVDLEQIKELLIAYQTKEDNELETINKTVIGAINELNAKPHLTEMQVDEKIAAATAEFETTESVDQKILIATDGLQNEDQVRALLESMLPRTIEEV